MSLRSELQNLSPSAIVELFVLDATALGASLLYFHAGTNELVQNVVWQGVTYNRFPVEATGFTFDGSGTLPRPHLKVSNALSAISALLLVYKDLLGARVIRKRTLVKFLDAANFAAGNQYADPTAAFPDDIFVIDRKVTENRDMVEFELTTSFDLVGVQLPRRQIIANVCTWKYRGPECGYTGTAYFDVNDQPVSTAALDICGKRVSSCKCRFGQTAELPYGGFPGAVLS